MSYQKAMLCAILLFFPRQQARAQTVTLGLFSEMSGTFAANGEDCRRGYGVAQTVYAKNNTAGRNTVRFYYADSQGDGRAATAEFKKAVEVENAAAVVTNRSQVGMALNPLSKQAAVPLLGIAGHEAFVSGNPYAYRFFPSADAEAEALAQRLAVLNIERAAIVTAEDEWLSSLAARFRAHFEALGGSITGEETVLEPQTDFASTIQRLRAASPQAVFVNLGISQSAIALKRMQELSFRPVIVSNFWSGKQEVIEAAGKEAVEGIVFVEPELRQPLFLEALHQLYGDSRATAVTYSCYAALAALLQAVSRVPGPADPRSIAEQLSMQEPVSLLDGELQIHEREAKLPLTYRTVQDGRVIALGSVRQQQFRASLRR